MNGVGNFRLNYAVNNRRAGLPTVLAESPSNTYRHGPNQKVQGHEFIRVHFLPSSSRCQVGKVLSQIQVRPETDPLSQSLATAPH